jgi:hypothetical protein
MLIQGEVRRGSEPHQWFFTVWVSFRGIDKQEFGPFGPWKSKSIAKKEMDKCYQLFSSELGTKVPEKIPVPSIFPEENKRGFKKPKKKKTMGGRKEKKKWKNKRLEKSRSKSKSMRRRLHRLKNSSKELKTAKTLSPLP